MAPPRDCPCHSKARYSACCAPFHKGERIPETAGVLMRSRYAAFALGLGQYLVDTLAADHPDRRTDPTEMGSSRRAQRFMDLCILHESVPAADPTATAAQVLFYARLFERGVDHSFLELSDFVREEGAWRYVRGALAPASAAPGDPRALTLEGFREVHARFEEAAPKASPDC